MTSPVRIGIAGLGRMGRRHAENIAHRVTGAKLAAACSPVVDELAWAKQTLGVAQTFTDYATMLERADVDAVFLVTPTTMHAQQIVDALHAGKHVFSEKPLSLDLDQCLRVEREAASFPKLKVMIGFVRRFDASYQKMREKVTAGAIGKPLYVRSHTLDKHDPSGFFVRFAKTSGGIFLDMSVHDIDSARWLLGNPKPLRAFATGTVAIHEGLHQWQDVDNGAALVEFDGGKVASFVASRTMAHGFEALTEVVGTAGRLAVTTDEGTPTFYERFADAFLREDQAFVDVIVGDRAPPLTLHDATEATRIGIALRESLLGKRLVEL